MPWFRVDDSLAVHPKAITAGNAALGLWVRAGSWCAQQLTDGFVPLNLLATLGAKPKDAQALVDAGMWLKVSGGYRFHDWGEYQPSRESVETKRSEARERMQRVREARSSREHPANVRANNSARSPYPGPARPDPTQEPLLTLAGRLTEAGAADFAAGLPTEVVEEWQRIAGPTVSLEDEARAYLARHGDTTPKDPRGAWLGWLRKARERADAARPAPPRPACPDPACTDGWLGEDPSTGTPIPCRTCRPHLKSLEAS